MKQPSIYIYRAINFDGNIYVKLVDIEEHKNCKLILQKEGKDLAIVEGLTAVFKDQLYGQYQAIALLTNKENKSVTVISNKIIIVPNTKKENNPGYENNQTEKQTREIRMRCDGINDYYLELKLKNEKDIDRLKTESPRLINLISNSTDKEIFSKIPANYLLGDIVPNTYKIFSECGYDELVNIADEIELLDYVIYCSVVPDTTNMNPPELPIDDSINFSDEKKHIDCTTNDVQTPDFQHLQTYLQPNDKGVKGMNVLSVWKMEENGSATTVRHLDFGVYRNHEDFKKNITVVNSRAETRDCNHGTASTGCIAASKNGFGVTGIAYGSKFYFYDTGDLDLIIRDAVPGDIVSLDLEFVYKGKHLPVINSKPWWNKISSLTKKGVVVILAAGNGGLDLSIESGNMNQFGDSGSFLVGACNHNNGIKCRFSNHNHETSLINSWGNGHVVTTGYSSLQKKPGNNRNYSKDFSGTSSATPLCAGALALIQSYAINNFGVYLNAYEMRRLIMHTGYSEGADHNIGHRPNVEAAINALKTQFILD
ncbi:S8 family serine peptidase [Candidatus Cardinium hertigii]|uniref:S8 family serine peptidase n=1 Tax=Candidatus Cardinium hertigii TaxID=247481 RepID=UPI003D7C5E0B